MKILNKTKEPLIIAIVSIVLLSGIFAFAPRKKTEETSGAVPGSPQSELSPSASDLFSCGGRDDCLDDSCPTGSSACDFPESQHKYTAQAYDKFGFPLSGVTYKWTKNDVNDLLKFRDLSAPGSPVDQSSISGTETDQEIYVQPNEDNIGNGTATVNVLGYIGSEEAGKSQSIDVNLYFCLNSWPNTATFPFSDTASPPTVFTNFETFYCKDRGSATNPGDDYSSLKVVERSNKVAPDYSYLCSGGGGNNLKCSRDYYIKYDGLWTRGTINTAPMSMPDNVKSPDAVGLFATTILATEGNEWAYNDGDGWTSGNLLTPSFPTIIPAASWLDGPVATVPLKPTALAINGTKWLLIEGNFYATNDSAPFQLPVSVATATLAEAGWPTDVQFPDDVAWWSYRGDYYLLALKNNYYRIYSNGNGAAATCSARECNQGSSVPWGSCSVDSDCRGNKCNPDFKCETQSGRIWGSCENNSDCYWGESFSLYSKREWPTNITEWEDNVRFPIKTIGIDSTILMTSSCENSGGICLLKEFLLIANPACSDGIDNDSDGQTDYPADTDCTSPDDNSESGTCDDGIDNDNDGAIDYPDDFSCDSYSAVEEDGCIPATCYDGTDNDSDGFIDESDECVGLECCDNIDNDSDGLVDQADIGCDDKADVTEANACADGIDNDGDGLIDLFDPGCLDAADNDEKGITQCDDGIDNDEDGSIDYPADFGCDRPGDDQELNNGANQCNDGIDNDGDGNIDQNDLDCADWEDNTES